MKTYSLYEVKESNGRLLGEYKEHLTSQDQQVAADRLKNISTLCIINGVTVEPPVLLNKQVWGLSEDDSILPLGETIDWIGKTSVGYVFILVRNRKKHFVMDIEGNKYTIN